MFDHDTPSPQQPQTRLTSVELLMMQHASAGAVREICGTVSRSVLNRGADLATDARTTY